MKKRMKRFLVLLMTAALMVSMLSAGALAGEETGETSAEAVSEEAPEEALTEAEDAEEAAAAAEEAAATETDTDEAETDAEEAQTDAEEAETAADEAKTDADEVQTAAEEAETDAEEAQAASEDVIEEAAAAETEAETASASEEVIEEASVAEEASDAAALEGAEVSDEALAEDTTLSYLSINADSKTITVTNDGSVTSEIQDAIDYIDENATDKTGWTILVYQGLYDSYTVPDDVSVTVMAQSSTQLVAVSDDISFTVDETGISVDASSQTITVSDAADETYEIQNAIDYISAYASDITGWTIVVNSGTYSRFVVYDEMDGLTVKAADGASVTVNVLNGSEMQIVEYVFINNKGTLSYYYYDANNISGSNVKNEYRGDHWQQGFSDAGGVVIMCADEVTISGLTFQMGSTVTTWTAAAISTMNSALERGTANDFTIESCTFMSSDNSDETYGIFVASGNDSWVSTWKIDGCTFTDVCYGIAIVLDNFVTQATITDNTFTGCVDAIENGYACNYKSVSTEGAYLTVTGNTITGTASTHTKVCILDGNNSDALGTVTITGNTLEHVNLLLCSIDTTTDQIYTNNTIGECSWVMVTEMSHDTASNDTSVTFVASTESGYWELTGDYSSISASDLTYINQQIEAANASGATTLTIDLTKFTETEKLTSEPDGVKLLKTVINWVSTTSVTVTKAWDDSDDADGIRPDSVTVELYQNGEATGKIVTLSAENDWTAVFDSWCEDYVGLPVHDEDGTTDYTYTVVETAVDGYTTAYSELTGSNEDGWAVTVTNTHEYVTTSIAVTKVWDDSDNADGIRPDSVTVGLYADGVSTGQTVTLTEEGGWAASFTDLPAYSYDTDGNAAAIAYTVAESDVDGYTASYSDLTGSIGEGYTVTVTNVHEETEEEVPEEKTPEEKTPEGEDTEGTEETPEEEEIEDTEETKDTGDVEDTEDTEDTGDVEETEDTEEDEDTEDTEDTEEDEDTGDTEDAEDDDATEEVEDVEATDTGDPGVILWIAVLCAALASVLIGRKKIAG